VPVVEVTSGWAVVIDCVVWAVVGIGVGFAAYKWPSTRLAHEGWLTRPRHFERDGRWYETRWRIRRWKDHLPEAGSFFAGGFSKRGLDNRDGEYLSRFVVETRRAELTHWIVLAFAPLFFLWNPWWLSLVMVAYALVANVPCIVVQRYNRARLVRVLSRRERRRSAQSGPPSSVARHVDRDHG
jgi:glycosyl-4,4'-diaponeurosporenoate acyltransferase